MSTIAVNAITNASGGNTATINGMTPTATSLQGFRNRIINGAMVIDQRNAGASVTASVANTTTYTLDRFAYYATQTSKFTVQQNAGSVTRPSGFTNYLGITSSSAYSVLSSDTFLISQSIEGFNVADLNWGTANAQAITLSFWVRSSLTGTFGGSISNNSSNRSYIFSYSISSANTWEYKTVTISGDTTGTWTTDNSAGMAVRFGLGSGSTFTGTAGSWSASNLVQPTGSVSVVGTNGATFYITGVQLEVGSVATDFERRPYGTELALCQRYYYKQKGTAQFDTYGTGYCESTTTLQGISVFPVTMRTSPTALEQSGTAGDYQVRVSGTSTACSSVPTFTTGCPFSATSTFTVASGLTAGQGGLIRASNSNSYLAWSAEL